MKVTKRPKVLLIVFIIAGSVLAISVNSLLFAKDKADNKPVSYPVSFAVDNSKFIKKEDSDLGFELDYPTELTYRKSEKKISKEVLKNVINISDDKDPNDSRFNLEVIPIKSNSKESVLSVLEKYIVNYVGIIPKNNQKVYKERGLDIAQIGYNPFQGDGMNYFRVLTAVKKGDYSLIFSMGYLGDISEKDSLSLDTQLDSKIYKKMLDSLQISDTKIKDSFNTVDISQLNPVWLKEYHENNLKFDTNI